jgi:hypothetical protein
MKETKKSDAGQRVMAINRAWLERNKVCDDTRIVLGQLQLWLQEHFKTLDAKAARCSRFSADIMRMISNGGTRCLLSPPDVLAAQLLAGRTLDVIILEEQGLPQMKQMYGNIRFVSGPNIVGGADDLMVFKEWDAERAAIQILKEAIAQQKKIVAAITKSAMEKFSKTVSQARVETAREVLVAVAQLRLIVEPDQALANGLGEDEIDALRPKPFPRHLLSSEAIKWMLDCVEEKILTPEELSGLEVETVSPQEPTPQDDKRESWNNCAV